MSGKQFAILTAAVVPLVLIATYLSVGTGGRQSQGGGHKTTPTPDLTSPHLLFDGAMQVAGSWGVPAVTSAINPGVPPDEEIGIEGHRDFWFKNENDVAVEVVVTRLSCNRCVTMKLALAPQDWEAVQAAKTAAAAALGPAALTGGNLQAAAQAPAPGDDAVWVTLESQEIKHEASGFSVPAKRAGWARLGWKDQQPGHQRISANLHTTSSAGKAPPIYLETGGNFIDPVRVLPDNKNLAVGTLVNGDAPRTAWFTVYSSTRDRFSLEAEPEAVQQKEHPFVKCGRPEPLSPTECGALQTEQKRRIRCGYRVPVSVSERLADGRENDLGPFQTGVALTSDVFDKTIGLVVSGTVRGEVTVLGGQSENNKDRVGLGAFPRSSGITRRFTVEALADVPLELERTPAFIKIEGPRRTQCRPAQGLDADADDSAQCRQRQLPQRGRCGVA